MSIFDKIFKKPQKQPFQAFGEYNFENSMVKEYKNINKELHKKYSDCLPFNKNIKLLLFADTHGKINYDIDYDFSAITDYDVCLLLGDISCDDIREILKHIDKTKAYGILGNHDYYDNLSKFDIPNINGKVITINGVDILGIEGSIKYKEEQPGFTIEEGYEFVKDLPTCDICITHTPPFGANGLEHNTLHIGAPYINEYIYKNKCPIVISGHNHIDSKHTYKNNTFGLSVYKQRIIEFDHGKFNNIF